LTTSTVKMIRHLRLTCANMYSKLFPLGTLRRFIADQITNWIIFVVYYGAIITVCTYVSFVVLRYIGHLTIVTLAINIERSPDGKPIHDTERLAIEIGFGVITMIIIPTFFLFLHQIGTFVYEIDYIPWVNEQQKYLMEMKDGRQDAEAVYVPVTTSKLQQIGYKVIPLGSLLRYSIRLIVGLFVFCVIVVCHMYISVKTYPFKPEDHWLVIWILSLIIHTCVGFVLLFLGYGVYWSISQDWVKFRRQQTSAVAHEN
jgi:hypothetical protein